ncbi:MAG: DsbA family protein, partial [Deltaproteobacteria bacterium]
LAGLLLACFASACVTRGEIEEIKEGQKRIEDKLDGLSKTIAARPAGPPPPPQQRGPDPSKVYAFPVGEAAVHGPKDAWVTIVEVSDFQCPFCGRATATLKDVEKAYGADVRIAFKHNPLPFHNRAMPAAVAVECAHEQDKFWPMHDKLFENQRALEDKDLESYAAASHLDMKKFKACSGSDRFKKRIEEDQVAAARLGARGTPAFFINGRFLSGAQPFPAFKALIDEELRKAKDSKLDKKDYYAKMVEEKGDKSM